MRPPTLSQLVARLDRELRTTEIPDHSLNGLQVAGPDRVRKVALAVDASQATISAAQAAGADLLIVHHGLFWGQSERLTGRLYHSIRMLMDGRLGLYASHLPLDVHPRLGNNAALAKGLKLQKTKGFGTYQGVTIGLGGVLARPQPLHRVGEQLQRLTGTAPRVFAFGKSRVRRVAVVSGGAGDLVAQAGEQKYDLIVTGEISHPVYHVGRECRVNILAGGHYATETFGIRAIGGYLSKAYQMKSVFLDFPTGL